jgi:SAM-dependent methyltransferase
MSESSNDLEEIPCIFGHGFNDEIAIEENGFKGRRCKTCRLIYISPRPSKQAIFDLYHHDKAFLPASRHTNFNPVAELAAHHHIQFFKKLMPRQSSVLEIGCGGGHFLNEAKKHGYIPFGIELNPHQAVYVQNECGIPCESKPFALDSFGSKTFTAIFHVDVLSHLADPIRDFKIMYDKLKPGGYLLFETGNGADIDPKYYGNFRAFQYPDHVFFFGEDTVHELLRQTGFVETQVFSWSILPQLLLMKLLQGGKPTQVNPKVAPNLTTKKQSKIIKSTAAYVFHFLRYKIGRLQRGKKVPRTLFVISRKPE